MNQRLRKDADEIIQKAIKSVLPDTAVKIALKKIHFLPGKLYLVAIGKAAWQMAAAAIDILGRIDDGIVITKYGHDQGEIEGVRCYEAGHPVPDENSFAATEKVLEMVGRLKEDDNVLFLLSGGGSALFEKPMIPAGELQDITKQLLACGADIREINTIRKHLSLVKGGRFAQQCMPAHVFSIVLSDIIGSPLDDIASGPAYPDSSTSEEALEIVKKYHLSISKEAYHCLQVENPKTLTNVTTYITGSVSELCTNTAEITRQLGYETILLTDCMDCEAKDAGFFLGDIARTWQPKNKKIAFIAGGETVVHLTGNGKGGRNQELALAAASRIAGLVSAAVFSIGSDGTDGPTDAAGGYVDGDTVSELMSHQIDINNVLQNNDAYHALKAVDGLIITGPTGTNVNDVSVVLVDRNH